MYSTIYIDQPARCVLPPAAFPIHSYRMVPGKAIEWPGDLRPAALCIALYSLHIPVFFAHNSCGKVMFSQACVSSWEGEVTSHTSWDSHMVLYHLPRHGTWNTHPPLLLRHGTWDTPWTWDMGYPLLSPSHGT